MGWDSFLNKKYIMGIWTSKRKVGESKVTPIADFKEEISREITDFKDLKICQGDFVIEKEGRFRDFYTIGAGMGTGTFGEVREWTSKLTNWKRAVKVVKKETLKGNDRHRFFYEMEIMK